MTKSVSHGQQHTFDQVTTRDWMAGRRSREHAGDGQNGSGFKEASGRGRDSLLSRDRQGTGDAVQTRRNELFEQAVVRAEKQRYSLEDETENTEVSLNTQMLFDSSRGPGSNAGNVGLVTSSLVGTELQVERIASQVQMLLAAEGRAVPILSPSAFNMTIPMKQYGAGLDRVEVKVSENVVTVILCFDHATGQANEQVIAAAAHLGQSLQDHLPGRRIRIAQLCSPTDISEESASTGSAEGASGFPFAVARQPNGR